MFKKVNPKVNFPEIEERILKFWKKNKIFEKSVKNRPKSKEFTFYDGPPYATGMPHYGHLLPGTIKDVIPRYKTMQGYRVERVWGWDTHGLPIENIVERELGFKSKLDIKDYGIDKFNEACRSKVFGYVEAWKKIIARTGRWVDMENAYVTLTKDYMESVWWVFSQLWGKGLVYEGYKVMPYCPRCATGLSSFEVGLGGYQEKVDKAITVKFELEDEPGTYLLAWTTTPWTLPGNLALAVGEKIKYVKVKAGNVNYILAKDRYEIYKSEIGGNAEEEFSGKELVGKKYKPLFSYYKNPKKAFEVVAGDFVTTEDGTGIVHIAPAFGEDDYAVSKKNGIDFFMPVDDLGRLTKETDYEGMSAVEPATNEKIINDLSKKIIKVEDFSHQYPYCWRCDTPLIYKAIDSWFVSIEKLRPKMQKNNKDVYWMPEFVGKGRFAKLIEGAPDWNISRNRYWGVPIPVWRCPECKERIAFNSVAELEKATKKKINDIHLHKISGLKVRCKCGKDASLTGEILDVWFDSGSMPYGRMHYPFENKERFSREFPADFIAEGIDQTRGWFNSLLILGTALFDKSPFKSVIVNGTVLAEDGQKMSKRLNNYPDPMDMMNKYGADALRFYLMNSPAVRAEDLRFSEKGVDELVKKVTLTLWNSYSFFTTYASLDKWDPDEKGDWTESKRPLMDRWLISRRNTLIKNVTGAMEKYDLSNATRLLIDFMDELSNWYIRRSRKRFWKSEDDSDKKAAYHTLYKTLMVYVSLIAPFMPFVTEEIYQNMKSWRKGKKESIHLSEWPEIDEGMIDKKIEKEMELARQIVEAGLAQRNEKSIKVRQPLASLTVISSVVKLPVDLINIISEEVNVKTVMLKKGSKLSVKLDTKITPGLKAEGIARDFIRFVQDGRKKAGFNVEDRIKTAWETSDAEIAKAIKSQSKYIAKETLSVEFSRGDSKSEYSEIVKLDGKEVRFGISRK